MRVPVLQALAAIKTDAKGASPAIVKALADTESAIRRAAAETLGRIGTTDGEAGDALRQALRDPEAEVRLAASAALLATP
jgi:HEAT repeat protein